ncbi:MAG: hypothetical protein ACJAUV_002298 [Flavobacteriales bacterium]|jgi:hypothetical protein
MKIRVFMLLILGGAFLPTMGQNKSTITLATFEVGSLKNIQVVGVEAIAFTDSLFAHFNKKHSRYITKFKKVVIEGIKDPVTFQVHQGYHGTITKQENDTSKSYERAYFRTFTKKNDSSHSTKKKKENEQDAVTIYLKQGKNYGIKTDKELELIKKYLLTIYS